MSENRSHWKMQRKRAKDRRGNVVHRADTETAYTVVPSRPKPLGTVSCSRTIVSRPGSSCCRVCERVRIDRVTKSIQRSFEKDSAQTQKISLETSRQSDRKLHKQRDIGVNSHTTRTLTQQTIPPSNISSSLHSSQHTRG